MAKRTLRESLIIKILTVDIEFPNISASLIAWTSAVKILASGGNLKSFEVRLVQ